MNLGSKCVVREVQIVRHDLPDMFLVESEPLARVRSRAKMIWSLRVCLEWLTSHLILSCKMRSIGELVGSPQTVVSRVRIKNTPVVLS